MRIVKLQAENYKRLKAVTITPTGDIVQITGMNEQGKSSVLDSIYAAIGGRDGSKDTDEPIHQGESRAVVEIDLGDLVVTKKWTKSGASLVVEQRQAVVGKEDELVQLKSPQGVLDALISKIAFDPIAFSGLSAEEQKKTLLGLVNVGIDLDDWKKQRDEAYAKRTNVNREIERVRGKGAQEYPDVPETEVSAADFTSEIDNIVKRNEERRQMRVYNESVAARADDIAAEIDAMDDKIAAAKKEVDRLEAVMASKISELQEANESVKNLIKVDEDETVQAVTEKLKDIETLNAKVRHNAAQKLLKAELKKLVSEADELTSQIDGLDQMRSDAIKAAKFPVDGLGFNDTGVTYRDIPFKQCSAAERLRVSVAIAMAMNPNLRILRISDGSLLDSKNMEIISSMCKANDFQAWIEVVDESKKRGVVIEDGEVVAVNE